MNATEVILLVFGFLSISISFFVGNRKKAGGEEHSEEEGFSRNVWTEKEEELVRGRIQSILEEEKENILAETMDTLNRKSNEKIMEFDEFSGQLMEKIEHNHEEVVFMYNMLTTKEEEWKEAAARPAALPKKPKAEPEQADDVPAPQPSPVDGGEQTPADGNAHAPITGLEQLAKSHPAKTKTAGRRLEQAAKGQEPGSPQVVKSERATDPESEQAAPISDNKNNQILKLHKQGKSVVEISKELNVGQGEVKLTLALYGGKR
jgi:hypothetical protein